MNRHISLLIGTVAGPHPYPLKWCAISTPSWARECLTQMPELGWAPARCGVIACVGGGSNAMGIFYDYISARGRATDKVEAAGEGLDTGRHAASLERGFAGRIARQPQPIFCRMPTARSWKHTASAPGWDYPGVGPGARLARVIPAARNMSAADRCTGLAGISRLLPHRRQSFRRSNRAIALAYATQLAPRLSKDKILLVNLSGRGDKDLHIVAEAGGMKDMGCKRRHRRPGVRTP